MQTSSQATAAFETGDEPLDDASDIDLIDIKEMCRLVGGSRPVHPSTVYRLIQTGKLPKPIRKLRRWSKPPAVAAVRLMIETARSRRVQAG